MPTCNHVRLPDSGVACRCEEGVESRVVQTVPGSPNMRFVTSTLNKNASQAFLTAEERRH